MTWWLVGQEEENRDSLTGMNLTQSETLLCHEQRRSASTRKSVGSVHSEQSLNSGSGNSSVKFAKTVSFKKRGSDPQCSTGHSPPADQAPKMSLPGTVFFENQHT